MTRQKRTSRILEKAKFRVASFQAIDPNLKFDEQYNLQNLTQTIEEFSNVLDAYNAALALVDSSKTKVDTMEKTLRRLSDKMLKGVGFKYGTDSNEYELAGGVTESERTRKGRITRLKNQAESAANSNSQTE
ncbi:hypothetical protein NIES2100_02460 [Calothrix sp. NIES-2100]|uniref:hypothetical protein n=1 Tax=Calothrix sp. NIES-2100 TaxID=1954172 RepID=UPI000B601957|nr:hypothetical protein NIES2100_02460 [Calothrix sp. NIES-2100]